MLIIFGGLPGTGTTSLARELSRKLHAVYLRIDAMEHGICAAGCLQGGLSHRCGKPGSGLHRCGRFGPRFVVLSLRDGDSHFA